MNHTLNVLSQASTWAALAVIIGCIPAIMINPYSVAAWGGLLAAVIAIVKHTPLPTPPPVVTTAP